MLLDLVQMTCLSCLSVRVCKKRRRILRDSLKIMFLFFLVTVVLVFFLWLLVVFREFYSRFGG